MRARSFLRGDITHALLDQHRHLIGGELEVLAIRDTLRGDRVFRPAWINASDPEGVTTGGELTTVIVSGQTEGLGEGLEAYPFRVKYGSVGKRNGYPESQIEAPTEIHAGDFIRLDGETVPRRNLATGLQHLPLKALAERRGQVFRRSGVWHVCFGFSVRQSCTSYGMNRQASNPPQRCPTGLFWLFLASSVETDIAQHDCEMAASLVEGESLQNLFGAQFEIIKVSSLNQVSKTDNRIVCMGMVTHSGGEERIQITVENGSNATEVLFRVEPLF